MVWLTEPLVIEGVEGFEQEYEDWKYNRDEIGADYLDYIGPFRVPIAPDDLHKANISGGSPVEMSVDTPQVDGIVFNERHGGIQLLPYLRCALEWGGFPGFECYMDRPVKFIDELKRDLLPF